MANQDPNLAVVAHLIRLIQDSADVRYYVGGPCTQMRNLLVAAIEAGGFEGDPREALKPPPHRANDEARVVRLAEEVERLESGIEALRVILAGSGENLAIATIEKLQRGEAA
jgi:hypothetical protein